MLFALPTQAWMNDAMTKEDQRIQKSRLDNYNAIQKIMDDLAARGEEATPDRVNGILDQFRTTDTWLTGALPSSAVIDGMTQAQNQRAQQTQNQMALDKMKMQDAEREIATRIISGLDINASTDDAAKAFTDAFGDQVGAQLFTKYAGQVPKILADAKAKDIREAINTYGNVVYSPGDVDKLLENGQISQHAADTLRATAKAKESEFVANMANTYSQPYNAKRWLTDPAAEQAAIAADYKERYGRDISPESLANLSKRAATVAKNTYDWHRQEVNDRIAQATAGTNAQIRAQQSQQAQAILTSQMEQAAAGYATATTDAERQKFRTMVEGYSQQLKHLNPLVTPMDTGTYLDMASKHYTAQTQQATALRVAARNIQENSGLAAFASAEASKAGGNPAAAPAANWLLANGFAHLDKDGLKIEAPISAISPDPAVAFEQIKKASADPRLSQALAATIRNAAVSQIRAELPPGMVRDVPPQPASPAPAAPTPAPAAAPYDPRKATVMRHEGPGYETRKPINLSSDYGWGAVLKAIPQPGSGIQDAVTANPTQDGFVPRQFRQ